MQNLFLTAVMIRGTGATGEIRAIVTTVAANDGPSTGVNETVQTIYNLFARLNGSVSCSEPQ